MSQWSRRSGDGETTLRDDAARWSGIVAMVFALPRMVELPDVLGEMNGKAINEDECFSRCYLALCERMNYVRQEATVDVRYKKQRHCLALPVKN